MFLVGWGSNQKKRLHTEGFQRGPVGEAKKTSRSLEGLGEGNVFRGGKSVGASGNC